MRKGQSSSSAAAFIAIMTVLIILYILFLPPDIREELLSDGGSNGGSGSDGSGSSITTNVLFRETIGKVSYLKDTEKYYDIPSVRIYAPTSGQLLKGIPSVFIKNALFDKEQAVYTTTFDIDKKSTTNVVISFTVTDHYGPLSISLNDRKIFNGEIEGNKFLRLSDSDLSSTNELKFSVPNPGVIFWNSNKYALENVQITGDVTDYTSSSSTQKFSITQTEKDNLESATLYFRPVCTLSDVGPLEIKLNNKILFDAVADCGTRSFASIDINEIKAGSNELRFSVDKGSYLLDNLMVKIELEKPAYKTYFFDISDEFFVKDPESARCGDYDDVCPPGCSDIKDADCCFKRNGNWCALPTKNINDRCVYYVDPGDCDLCPTGYYNKHFNVPDTCEGKCGDNEDGICPSDCPYPASDYDADCCWDENPDFFFCREVPITGLTDKCRASISYTQCDLCPSGYEDEDGREPDACDGNIYTYKERDESLDEDYDVRMVLRFVDSETRKRIDVNINGHIVSADTREIEFKRNIDEYVRSGSNSIELIPREDINIAELRIELIKVK